MRTSFVVVLICGVALVAAMIGRFSRRSSPPAASTLAGSASASEVRLPAGTAEPMGQPVQALDRTPADPPDKLEKTPPSIETAPESRVEPTQVSTPFSRAIDTLVSTDASFQQKQVAWKDLRESGQLDRAIEALKQGATENPMSASYAAALGQAQLQKAGELSRNGGTISEMGILGMQADQNLEVALQLDPANWEAQFFKAAAMAHWPLELNKGEEVIQRLSRLIDQQETMPAQPEFAQAYVVLGDQYQKMGQPDYAMATWQFGAQRFPGNPVFRQKIQGQ